MPCVLNLTDGFDDPTLQDKPRDEELPKFDPQKFKPGYTPPVVKKGDQEYNIIVSGVKVTFNWDLETQFKAVYFSTIDGVLGQKVYGAFLGVPHHVLADLEVTDWWEVRENPLPPKEPLTECATFILGRFFWNSKAHPMVRFTIGFTKKKVSSNGML